MHLYWRRTSQFFCGVGGGTTAGPRCIEIAIDAEFQGALGVVLNQPTDNELVASVKSVLEIPVIVKVVSANEGFEASIDAGVDIFNVSGAADTPRIVDRNLRVAPEFPVIATGGPSDDTILKKFFEIISVLVFLLSGAIANAQAGPISGPCKSSLISEIKYNVPIWLGESGENTDGWIKSFRGLLEENQIGWCFWTYRRLDTTRTIASIKRPEDWDEIVNFSESPRAGFDEIRRSRPPKEKIEKAFRDYLENIKFENCHINDGYQMALGVK